jgi:hypothetical protein
MEVDYQSGPERPRSKDSADLIYAHTSAMARDIEKSTEHWDAESVPRMVASGSCQ